MWRSQARKFDFFIRCATRSTPEVRNQVFSKSHFVIPFQPVYVLKNPRFFSQNSISNDEKTFLDENPEFISEESEPLSTDFDETSSMEVSQEEGFVVGGDDQMGSLVEEEEEEEPVVVVVEKEIQEIDVELVEKVLSVLQSSLDGSLEDSLDKMELSVSEEFLMRVIGSPLVPGENLINFFKWASEKPGFSMTTRVLDCLVRAVCAGLKKRDAYALWDLVKEIGEKEEKGVLNTEMLNELISLFWRLGKGKAGLEVFNKFEEFGCEPNADSYYCTIEALYRRSMFDEAWSVCEKMLNAGKLPDSAKIGNIISCFCKGKKAKDAHLVYLMAKEKNKSPAISHLNFLISSLCKEDDTVKMGMELLEDFTGKARKYAIKPFSIVLRSLCRIKDFEEAKKLLNKMISQGPPPGNAAFNSVVTGLSKAGEMEEAKDLVKVMEGRGLKPDVYTYTVIMSGYTKGGQMEEALKLLSEAKEKHLKLTPVTYHTLIRGYCKLEEFDKALKLLNEMKDSGVEANADEYNKIIQSLCLKALDWRTAEKLFEEMNEKGLYLNGITRGLIKAVKELEEQELNADAVSVEA